LGQAWVSAEKEVKTVDEIVLIKWATHDEAGDQSVTEYSGGDSSAKKE
jgi:hypothetical protein